jgi:signal transduction histidine kinase
MMATPTPFAARSRWYQSFYWRIAVAFVVFVVAVIVAQSVIFGYLLARSSERSPARSPNNLATTVAADIGSALAEDSNLDLGRYLGVRYGREPWRVFVVMKDGSSAGSSSQPLAEEIRRSAEATLAGIDIRAGAEPRIAGPVVTAPIQVAGALRGLVVLPPPPPGGIGREVGRFLTFPGTLLLVLATALVAVILFAPARRRLRGLEEAAERFGAGDLLSRAPEEGGDEIARVARAFNRMAGELAARDEALRTSDRLRRRMLADVSHELKTPLTAMRGYLETLGMPEVSVDPATRARYLETIERETRRLERIVKDLLDLARYENAAVPLDVRMFAIERVFDHVVRRYERETRERNVCVRAETGAVDQLVGDPDRLEQVVDNLVANALRHTPPGGTIELRAAATPRGTELAVVDSGEGIAPTHVPHVFDRFYKVDGARAAGAGGSGLGLSIAKAIVERHGGTIEVASEPGRTAFTVVLPQQPGEPHTVP